MRSQYTKWDIIGKLTLKRSNSLCEYIHCSFRLFVCLLSVIRLYIIIITDSYSQSLQVLPVHECIQRNPGYDTEYDTTQQPHQ